MKKNKTKKAIILSALFLGPLIFYIFLSLGIYHHANLPILTEKVQDVKGNVTFKNHFSVVSFLGTETEKNQGRLFNLNEVIYKRYRKSLYFQSVLIAPKGAEKQVNTLKKKLSTYTDISNWKFVFMNDVDIKNLFKSFDSPYTIGKDLRWRIEHAQVVEPNDHALFKTYGIIPSIQPTHATSDMRWAEERLCTERLSGAYAYQSLLQSYGKVALGTDFPIEDYKPNKTFYAAVYRQDGKGLPAEGFQAQSALTNQQALLGMTTWAAFAQFDENRLGRISNGYEADFVISDLDWFSCNKAEIYAWTPWKVFVHGSEQ